MPEFIALGQGKCSMHHERIDFIGVREQPSLIFQPIVVIDQLHTPNSACQRLDDGLHSSRETSGSAVLLVHYIGRSYTTEVYVSIDEDKSGNNESPYSKAERNRTGR